ncbi:glycoside hydrolase family 19 protein [Streptomyces luteireticuli]|uniref:glycoside hydrolase family 19 protein n=1 Tax=Streptomyces luteireticuli TaxID=173858 RepID=UPI0035576558
MKTRRIAALPVAALSLAGIVLTGPAPVAHAASSGSFTGLNGKCLDLPNGNTANGTPVQIWDCNGGGNQNWSIEGDQIKVLGKCLDANANGTADGTKVQVWDCNGTGAQRWTYNAGTRDVVNYNANKCLDVAGWNSGNGTNTQLWTCSGGANQKWNFNGSAQQGNNLVSEAQFNQMFPNRNAFYTYAGFVEAVKAFPQFAGTGSDETRKQEVAAFLANVNHETGGLVYIKEINTANYPHYCQWDSAGGCPAGQDAYYGRGPLQLSWNYNYRDAGNAIGVDLLHNPWLVEQNPAIAWKVALWFWHTSKGAVWNGPTPHDVMVNGRGFGETVRIINGIECGGAHPDQVQSRVSSYQRFAQILGTSTGGNLYC